MDNLNMLTMCVVLFTHMALFIAGKWVGKNLLSNNEIINKPKSFLKTQGKPEDNDQQISIDDTKVVLKIDTGGMEKKFADLGKTKKSDNDIGSAINKLKNMKGK